MFPQALGGQIGQFIENAISDAVNVLGHLTGQLDAAVAEVWPQKNPMSITLIFKTLAKNQIL